MQAKYTPEINTQIIISLLKAHNIKKVIASPGNTNVAFIGSIQNDPFFEVYSSVDERSAAYMACGLAEQSGEPVVLSCTGATASRNYVPGMTEAYYRKLPVLALTSTQPVGRVGHNIPQVIDRDSIQNDVARFSTTLPIVKDDEDLWECEVKANQAILELSRHGGGPVHINLPTTYALPFKTGTVPSYRKITRYVSKDVFPELKGKVAVFVGSHKRWSAEETQSLEKFCASNNAIVLCDHTSSYKGKFRVQFALAASQTYMDKSSYLPDILIQIGEVSGDYATLGITGKEVWRVNLDGELRDSTKKLTSIFEMSETEFFDRYANEMFESSYYDSCIKRLSSIRECIPEVPFSNIHVASKVASKLPKNSILHFGILNSLRSWNLFEIDNSIETACNVGGFGIDGILSSLLGASLHDKDKLSFVVLGDLAFFYDMNALGNRHVGKNLRILLINNGKGTEFTQYNHHAAFLEKDIDRFVASDGHYGQKSESLVKNYAKSLGFEYFSASNKTSLDDVIEVFTNPEVGDRPLLLEVFTDSEEESDALQLMQTIYRDKKGILKDTTKKLIGKKGINLIKKTINK